MENFQSLGLPEALLNALSAMQYNIPTPIQAQTIPSALQGQDVLGTAQTGTGKTAAYGIPLIAHLLSSSDNAALVLTPTRELAIQVLALLEQMIGRKGNIKTALIIGGDSMTKQLNQLSYNPKLIVGTPGRVNDHLDRQTLKLDNTKFLVLDETDRMLDMGFGIQLEQINKFLPHKRQTLMFSATLPHNIQSMASKYLKDAVRVSVGSTIAAADTIKQEIIRTSEVEKHGILLQQLEIRTGSCIIFVKTKMATEKLANQLREHGHSADAIHGDLRQRNREKVIRSFRNKKHRILVATDVAARGLDIPHLEHVINFDLPQCEEDFIHRIGRTGRAGVEGSAVSLITPQDHQKWRNISKMMNPGVKLDSSFDDPRGSSRSNNSRGPSRNGGGFRRSEGSSFPRSDNGGFRRSEGSSFPRSDNGGFRRSEGSSFPRSDNGGFRRSEGSSTPRSDNGAFRSNSPRSDSGFRRSEGSSTPRSDNGGFRSNSPRSDSGFRRPEGSSFPRANTGDFKRADGNSFRKPEGRSPIRTEGSNAKRSFPGAESNGGNFKRFGDSPKSNNSFRSSSKPSGFAGSRGPRRPSVA